MDSDMMSDTNEQICTPLYDGELVADFKCSKLEANKKGTKYMFTLKAPHKGIRMVFEGKHLGDLRKALEVPCHLQ